MSAEWAVVPDRSALADEESAIEYDAAKALLRLDCADWAISRSAVPVIYP